MDSLMFALISIVVGALGSAMIALFFLKRHARQNKNATPTARPKS